MKEACWFLLFVAGCSFLQLIVVADFVLPVVILEDNSVCREMQNLIEVLEFEADIINNSTSLLPGHRLQLLWGEWCGFPSSPGLALLPEARALWGNKKPPVMGVIGPTFSKSTMFVGDLLQRGSMPYLPIHIHMAKSRLLENRVKYPKSFGIVGSSSQLLAASIQLIKLNNWTKVNVFYDESQLYHSSSLYEIDQGLQNDLTINEYFISAFSPLSVPIDEAKSESRIFFLFMNEELVKKVLCLSFRHEVIFPAYQFVIADVSYPQIANSSIEFAQNRKLFSCSDVDLHAVVFKALIVSFHDCCLYFTNSQNRSFMKDKSVRMLNESGQTGYYLNALMSLALTVNYSLQESPTGNDAIFSKNAIRSLFDLEFSDFSGTVRFNETTGFVNRDVLVHQVVLDRESNLIATCSNEDGVINFSKQDQGQFVPWEITVVEVYPPHTPPFAKIFIYAFFVVAFVFAILAVILHMLTIYYRHTKQVKASSWKVLQFSFVGSYLLIISTIVHTIQVGFFPDTCFFWELTFCSLALGYTLVESTMCVLSWRLYRIFVAYKDPGTCLSNRLLTLLVFACVFFTAMVSAVWFIVDPHKPRPFQEPDRELNILHDPEGIVAGVEIVQTNYISYCGTQINPGIWFFLQHSLNIVLSIIVCVLVFLTRKVSMKEFRRVQLIRLNYMVNGGGLLFASVYIVLALNDSPDVKLIRYIMFSVILTFINGAVCILLYVPPLYSLFRSKSHLYHTAVSFFTQTTDT